MQYYTFELDKLSQVFCVIVTLLDKYKYKHVTVGLKCAPDFSQQVMEEVLQDVNNTSVYLENNCVFSFTWEHYILLLDKILHWLESNGFTINPLKCKQAIEETNWLGYWLTPTGLKPWPKNWWYPTNAKIKKSLLGAWFSWCCQPLLTNMVPMRYTHSCTPFQLVGKEDIALDTWNGSCFQMHESTYGTRLPSCLPQPQ